MRFRRGRTVDEPDVLEDAQHFELARLLFGTDLLWCHVPNGEKRSKRVAAKLKRMGVKPGVPDVLIFTRPPLAIELKRADGKGRVSKEQRQWLADLQADGWTICVAVGYKEAWERVKEHYGIS